MLNESARLSIHKGRLTSQRVTASRPIDRYANVYLKDLAILKSSVSELRGDDLPLPTCSIVLGQLTASSRVNVL